ncbi:stage II sporulation protein B [Bacillus cytotoxicus]|uniref:stage II sporulation protein B n=1 Tax=Bacillus cytotoxicus TaxID=580165 RepID=UPI0035CC30BC
MDKQSRKISIKVNGTEAKYEEKQKGVDEFDWKVVESQTPQNVVPFQQVKSSKIKTFREKWSNVLVFTIATAIIMGTALGMGMLHLLTGKGAREEHTAMTSQQYTAETKPKETSMEEQKEGASKVENTNAALAPITLFFVQGGLYSSEEKGQAAVKEWKENGRIAALKPNGDKYALVAGIMSDEKAAGKLMEQYKNDGIPVLKKNWEITDKALLKNDKELGIFLSKLQSLYSHFIKYVSSTQIGEKGNQAEIAAIEKEWKGLEKEGAEIKRNDVKKLYTYTSVAVQTIKEGKQNKSTVAKLNQVVIDGLLSYEKIVSQKVK